MARLISPPVGLKPVRWRPVGGPETVGAASTTSIGGATQDVATPFGLVAFQFDFPIMRGQLARRTRGWLTALHRGANATRWRICDWDGLSISQRHIDASSDEYLGGEPWSNNQPWSNGKNWHSSSPVVSVAEAASKGATVIKLGSSFWGHDLDYGDWIGFMPLHFGMYEITERINPGEYRIWPPLRKDIAATDNATLNPVIAMKLMRTNLPEIERGPVFIESLTVTLIEVPDYIVREHFTD